MTDKDYWTTCPGCHSICEDVSRYGFRDYEWGCDNDENDDEDRMFCIACGTLFIWSHKTHSGRLLTEDEMVCVVKSKDYDQLKIDIEKAKAGELSKLCNERALDYYNNH